MSLRFDGGQEGDVIILNRCPKCCRFIKNSSLPQKIYTNKWHNVIEPLLGQCQKCGEVKLEWFRD